MTRPLRVAFVSPLPPARTGIADYAAALLDPLREMAAVEVFDRRPDRFDPSRYDAIVYQIGNNPFHDFVYDMALAYPGVVVMHEANLHHLIAWRTIQQNDWDAYLREVEFDGGAEALQFAQRVRRLEVGPDYEGVPMLRRLLQASRGAIVHSQVTAKALRDCGFQGPLVRIPHGAWLPRGDRMGFRHRLGLDETTPLVGVFGFLKPYKRIAESLRAFQRVLRQLPDAKMILAGEPHPELPLESLLESLDLEPSVRILGFTPIEDFNGYISACDVVLNLRYPTVGESSGTLLRALGLGKAVIVSDVGSFAEFPDEVCLKVPVDASEEDFLFEYLNLLLSRPGLARALGARARQWAERECNWQLVARRYLHFLAGQPEEPQSATTVLAAPREAPCADAHPPAPAAAAEPRLSELEDYLLTWAESDAARCYMRQHMTRLMRTLQLTPPGAPDRRVLEMGTYLQITPLLSTRLGYGEVRGCYYGPAGRIEPREVRSSAGEVFRCAVELFNAEKDPFPYAAQYFDTVLCCELIEHLVEDPMFLLSEINRILKPDGHLVLTTPNIASLRALSAILDGYHPGFFPAYIRPGNPGEAPEARHNREYTPREIALLLRDAGFEPVRLETGPFLAEPRPEEHWIRHLLERYHLPTELRGDGIYAVGRKTGPLRERYPQWLYSG